MTEEGYYKSIYGDLIEIIDVNFAQRNVYPVMQKAEVIIAGFSTTCLIEAYAMRKKVLYMNFCGSNKYHVDFKSEILFEAHDVSKNGLVEKQELHRLFRSLRLDLSLQVRATGCRVQADGGGVQGTCRVVRYTRRLL